MNVIDCTVHDCPYLRRTLSGGYRCVHPDLPSKRFYRHVEGYQIKMLKECPKREGAVFTSLRSGRVPEPL